MKIMTNCLCREARNLGYVLGANHLYWIRCKMASFGITTSQRLWLEATKRVNICKFSDVMTKKVHTLLLIKDLAYHFYKRYEPFNKPKNSNAHFLILDYPNKLMDEINLNRIFRDKSVCELFPVNLIKDISNINLDKINTPNITYRYPDSIRNNILNYKETIINNVDIDSVVGSTLAFSVIILVIYFAGVISKA